MRGPSVVRREVHDRGGARVSLVILRVVAVLALILVLINPASSRRLPAGDQPIVLLDASLSMRGANGSWSAALDSARRLARRGAVVWRFGSRVTAFDTTPPADGASQLGPALEAAAGRAGEVIVLTDGDLDDVMGGTIPPDLLRRPRVIVEPRPPFFDAYVAGVAGPRHVTRARDARDICIEERRPGLYNDARSPEQVGRNSAAHDVVQIAIGQHDDFARATRGRLERRAELAGAVGGRRGIEGGDARAEAPHHGAPPRQPARAVERGAPRSVRTAHAERRIEQHDRLIARGQPPRPRGIDEHENQCEHRHNAQDHERHASASAIVNFPSYNARPTHAPASRAARAARRSSSEPTPPETMTSRHSAASCLAPSMSGPVSLPSRVTSL